MRPHDAQTSNMPMRDTVGRFLLHFRKNVSYHLGVSVTRPGGAVFAILFGVAILRAHNGHEAQLGPCQGMVKVVFQEVVLGKVGDVAGLDGGEEVDVAGV